jgi:hypothetical protein
MARKCWRRCTADTASGQWGLDPGSAPHHCMPSGCGRQAHLSRVEGADPCVARVKLSSTVSPQAGFLHQILCSPRPGLRKPSPRLLARGVDSRPSSKEKGRKREELLCLA